MSTRALSLQRPLGLHWWLILGVALTVGVLVNWAIAFGLIALFISQLVRPMDFILAFLLVAAGAALVNNSGGELTGELSLLTIGIVTMLVFYVLTNHDRVLALPDTGLTWALMAFLLLTVINAVRGVWVGNDTRNLGLEFIALLGLGGALLLGNAFDSARDLGIMTVGMIAIGFGPAIRGFTEFSTRIVHGKEVYAMAVPGIVGVLLFNLALRARSRLASFGWIVLSLPLFLHQLLSFGRGLWTGCTAALVFSVVLYGGRTPGARTRWARAMFAIGVLVGVSLFAAVQFALLSGHEDFLEEAWGRFASIGGTKISYETRSNIIRLWEYGTVAKLILKEPLFGYGIGYTFPIMEPFTQKVADQWCVHENYLLVWLKQGIVGVALFLWMLGAAIKMGVRGARRRTDPWESAWFASVAAGTFYLCVLSLSNFPFGFVNETFLMALFWGVGMAIERKGFVRFRWTPLPPPDADAAA